MHGKCILTALKQALSTLGRLRSEDSMDLGDGEDSPKGGESGYNPDSSKGSDDFSTITGFSDERSSGSSG